MHMTATDAQAAKMWMSESNIPVTIVHMPSMHKVIIMMLLNRISFQAGYCEFESLYRKI
jgi:hypothetical protein